ncbi:inner nuclear membrane protein enriched at telomere/subtelomere region [Sporothrix epigloea]|uniref:Inner nuclear membrane protein enriched at telomere/subtelomere region n=1 Tax=Sporothrix epigloea TaxID=1892477 RepID=A0ABP0DAM1_9PEZI
MSDSEADYLQPGFDPGSLTIPRLRSILVTYNVHYPSNAKKPELVEMFNEHVVPQAKKILARRARAKRSSMGIVDAQPSASSYSQSTTAYGEDSFDQRDYDDDKLTESRRHERRSSPRKLSSRAGSFAPADTATAPESETLAAARPPSRRARQKTPQVKLEPTEEERYLATPVAPPSFQSRHVSSADETNNTVFTYDNPFQSGSSPMSGSSPAQRRRTTHYDEPTPHKRSSTDAKSPMKYLGDSRVISPPARAALQRRVSPFAQTVPQLPHPGADELAQEETEDETADESEGEENGYTEDYDPLEPGEEFTPEEQLELTQEEAVQRQRRAISDRRATKQSKAVARQRRSVVSALATPFGVLLLTLLGIYAAWYRQEKRAVGFCGVGRLAVPLLSEQIEKLEWLPDWAREIEIPANLQVFVEPQCEPCPSHAFCYSDFTVRCESGYIEKQHPLSLNGLVPLPPTCQPDGERARRVKAVADKAIEELRDRRAKWECGVLVDEDGHVPEEPAIDLPVLKELISEKRSKKMSKEEFDDLWTAAIGDIESRDEVVSDSSATHAAAYARSRFRAHRATLARVPALVDLVLDRLATQKELWLYDDEFDEGDQQQQDAGDSSFLPDPFLFLPQLRDDVLRTTHSLAARERVWKHVRAVVEQNSNVRTGQREGRNGEVGRAWEWIGPIGNVTGPSTGASNGDSNSASEMSAMRRRRSGRASLMATPRVARATTSEISNAVGDTDSGRQGGGAGAAGPAEGKQSALHKRWQESRPIY